jgi:PAS domain S-box-containing protein
VEYRLRGTDGLYRWFLACGIPHRNANGLIVRWFGTATNIDRQKRAEAKQRFVARLSTLIHSLSDTEEIKVSAMRLLGEHLNVSQAVFSMVDADNGNAGEDAAGHLGPSLFGESVLNDLRAGRTVIIPDVSTDRRTASEFDTVYQQHGVHSFIASPLIKTGRLVAILSISAPTPRVWQPDESETLEETAERTWSAIRVAAESQVSQRAERAIQESETRFRMLVDQSPLSIQILTPSGQTVRVNRAWEKLWGVTIEDLKDYNMLADAQLVEKGIMPFIRRAFAGEPVAIPPVLYDTEQTLPNRSRRPDSRHWTQAFMYPIKDESGKIIEVVLIHEDISERKRMEEALRNSERQLRLIADSAPAFISSVDSSYRYLFANRACAERFGLTPESIVGATVEQVMGKAAFNTIRPYMERTFQGETFSYETNVPYDRLGQRYMQVYYAPGPTVDGKIQSLVAVVHDITEQREAEQARAYLAAIVQSSEDAIVSKDLDGIITSWNPAAERIYGYSAAEMLGKSKSIVIPADRPNELSTILHRMKAGEHIDHYETLRRRKDGSLIDLSITVSPIRSTNGQIVGASTIARDITERKELEMRLREESQILETVNAIGQRLSAELDLQKMVQAATDAATQMTGAQFGAFFYNVLNAAGESYTLYTISGVDRELFAHFPMPRNTEIFAPTFSGSDTVRSEDITRDPRYGKNAPNRGMPPGHLPVVSYLAVPVVSRTGEVLGGLFLGHENPAMFTQRHERLVEGMAAQAAIAIDNARLFQAERERSDQLAMAVREVHHRVKNSLQGVSALLEIQLLPGVTALPVESIRDSLSQIKTIALVHDLLAHDKPIGNVDAAQVLSKLIAMLSVSIGLPDHPFPIRLTADSVSMPIRHAIALALAVNELITNAAKHSRTSLTKDPFSHGGTIDVSLQKHEDEVCVSVQDDGPGFPQGFDPVHDAHIGLEMVQVLVSTDLRGAVSFRNVRASEPASGEAHGQGARVEITFSASDLKE